MECERCGSAVEAGEEREDLGETPCQDCYMGALAIPGPSTRVL